MKKYLQNLLIQITIILISNIAHAQKAISGLKTLSSYVTTAGMILGPVAFMVAGLIFMSDKQRGLEKVSGVVIGAMIFGGATSIFTLLYQAMN